MNDFPNAKNLMQADNRYYSFYCKLLNIKIPINILLITTNNLISKPNPWYDRSLPCNSWALKILDLCFLLIPYVYT